MTASKQLRPSPRRRASHPVAEGFSPTAPPAPAAPSTAPPAPGYYLLVTLGYLLLTLLILAPLWPRFSQAIPGGPVADIDGWQNVWNLWWMQRALAAGRDPFFTDLLYYPAGVALHLQTFNPSNGLLLLPITTLFGPVAGYNAALFLACLLSGLGGYALAYRVSGYAPGAFVGGLVFAFSPFHLTKIWDGQLELIALQWLAFYALFLLRSIEERHWRDPLLAGLVLAIIGYTSWYYLLFSAVFSLAVALWSLIAARGTRPALLARLSLIGGVALLALLPILLKALELGGGLRKRFNIASAFDPLLLRSANLLDFFLPSYLHPLWGEAAMAAGRQWHPYTAGWNMTLGLAALVLALIGGVAARRRAWPWLLAGGAAMLLALGPALQLGRWRLDLPLPYRLLLPIPGVGAAQRPGHFVVITTLCLAPLVALGLRTLLQGAADPAGAARGGQRLRRMLAFGLLALLGLEYLPPRWNLYTSTPHPYYATINDGPGALLELPISDYSNESSAPLEAQLVHGRPLLGGFVSRPPGYDFPRRAPYLRQLANYRPEPPDVLLARPGDGLQALRGYGIEQIIIHRAQLNQQQQAGLTAALDQVLPGLEPTYSDEQLVVYRLPVVEPRPYVAFDTGWYQQECDSSGCFRWMGVEASLALVNNGAAPVPMHLRLGMRAFDEDRLARFSLDGLDLGQSTITPVGTDLNLFIVLPPGTHRLAIAAPATLERAGGRELSLVVEP